ncbi:hypothetical protein G7061_09220 [Erysipelothrix sp. HDW6B]|nr:hypothetical protein [Erysipelothrix sp. HDW6B]QIK86781.1 hypothetical protein G7061_09220 [Erysipelothrix sp. HDW6B]
MSNEAILDAVNNPVEIVNQTSDLGPTIKYIGENATVVLNELGKVDSSTK